MDTVDKIRLKILPKEEKISNLAEIKHCDPWFSAEACRIKASTFMTLCHESVKTGAETLACGFYVCVLQDACDVSRQRMA